MDVYKRRFEKEHIYSIMGGLHLKDNPRQINLLISRAARLRYQQDRPDALHREKSGKMIGKDLGRDL
jgi:hypothetical protein